MLNPPSDETLASLSILRINADEMKQDYPELLMPFVIESLRPFIGKQVSPDSLRARLTESFGLIIPFHVCKLLIARLAAREYVVPQARAVILRSLPQDHGFTEKQTQAREQQAAVLSELQSYASKTYDYHKDLSFWATTLLSHLKELSISLLDYFYEGSALPEIADRDDRGYRIASTFILHEVPRDGEISANLLSVVQGHLLANALVSSRLDLLSQSYKNVTFYLDTPIILRLLGVQDEVQEEASLELVRLVHATGGKLAVFEHTVDECRNVLAWALEVFGTSSFMQTPMGVAAAKRGLGRSHYVLLLGRFDEYLTEKLSLTLAETPEYNEAFQIDEDLLKHQIEYDVQYSVLRPYTVLHDVNCVRSIYALRRGKRPTALEESVAVFLTSNVALAKSIYYFSKASESSVEVSPVLTDTAIAINSWLKQPLQTIDLPRLELMAVAHAGLNPHFGFWQKYNKLIQHLKRENRISDRDLQVLRSTMTARREIMAVSLGDQYELTEVAVLDVLDHLKQELIAEEALKYRALEEKHDEVSADRVSMRDHLAVLSFNVGRVLAMVLGLVAVLVVALGIAWGSAQVHVFNLHPILEIVVGFSVVFVATWGFLNLVWGVTIWGAITALSSVLGRFLLFRLLPRGEGATRIASSFAVVAVSAGDDVRSPQETEEIAGDPR
jgi:hypothetical protein